MLLCWTIFGSRPFLFSDLIIIPIFGNPHVKVRTRDAYLNYGALFSDYTLKVRI